MTPPLELFAYDASAPLGLEGAGGFERDGVRVAEIRYVFARAGMAALAADTSVPPEAGGSSASTGTASAARRARSRPPSSLGWTRS